MCWGGLNTGILWSLRSRKFSAGGKQGEEKRKRGEFRAQPPFLCQAWGVGLGMGRVGFDYCASPPFFCFNPSNNSLCFFSYWNMRVNTCSLQMAPLREWRAEASHWTLAFSRERQFFHRRYASVVLKSSSTSSSKREVTCPLSSPVWTRAALLTPSWGVKPWFTSEVHFCVGLRPAQVSPVV